MSTTETAAFAWADTGTVPFEIRPGAVPIKSWANPIDPRTFEQVLPGPSRARYSQPIPSWSRSSR